MDYRGLCRIFPLPLSSLHSKPQAACLCFPYKSVLGPSMTAITWGSDGELHLVLCAHVTRY